MASPIVLGELVIMPHILKHLPCAIRGLGERVLTAFIVEELQLHCRAAVLTSPVVGLLCEYQQLGRRKLYCHLEYCSIPIKRCWPPVK